MTTRDYTKVPGYEGMTGPQARYNYLHDLLDLFMGLTPADRDRMEACKVRADRGDCRYCSFSGFLGGDLGVCCAWRAEAQPDKAIEILEALTGRAGPQRERTPSDGLSEERWKKIETIIRHCPGETQLNIAQDACVELIKAISKVLRHGEDDPFLLDHLAEEIADVRIMCAQLVGIFDLVSETNLYIDSKLDRQLKRIREEAAHAKN